MKKDSSMTVLINNAAKRIYEARNGIGCKPWHHLPASYKEPYLLDAKVAFEVFSKSIEKGGLK